MFDCDAKVNIMGFNPFTLTQIKKPEYTLAIDFQVHQQPTHKQLEYSALMSAFYKNRIAWEKKMQTVTSSEYLANRFLKLTQIDVEQ